MGASLVSVVLGIAIVQLFFLGSSANHLSQSAANMFQDVAQHLVCRDGSCDVGQSESRMVTSMPVSQKQTNVDQNPGLTEEEILSSPYLDVCLDFVIKKDALLKDPKTKEVETNIVKYFKNILIAYEEYPEQRNEVLIKSLQEIVDVLMKLKLFFEREQAKRVPSQPALEPHVRPSVPPHVKPCVEPRAKPNVEPHIDYTEEIIAQETDISPPFVGSVRGTPGIHYPDYYEVPITSFSCGDKEYIPGFYADMETRCQVFHVCYAHRRESFLCPIGTTFNQPILACDYWYSSNCSLSPHYYDINAIKHEDVKVPDAAVQDIITIIEQERPALPDYKVKSQETELDQIAKFLPVKTKILEFPKPIEPKHTPAVDLKLKVAATIPAAKTKLALAAAVPVLKAAVAKKLASAALADAVISKKKVAGALVVNAAIAKKKVAAAALAADAVIAKKKVAGIALGMDAAIAKKKIVAAPVIKAGIAKTKMAAAAIPVAKATLIKPKIVAAKVAAAVPAAAIPVMKAKAVPLAKAAILSGPVLKTKAAMISPLTKKALALGYVKLLKAKKLALMG